MFFNYLYNFNLINNVINYSDTKHLPFNKIKQYIYFDNKTKECVIILIKCHTLVKFSLHVNVNFKLGLIYF